MAGLNDSAASDTVTRRLAPKDSILIIPKRYSSAIRRRRSRTERARGILEVLKAVKRKALESAKEEKVGFKTAEQTRVLPAKRKGYVKKKLPTNIIERIKFGKKLIRKRNNKEKWNYSPANEPDYNVALKYFDEENDEAEDENEDEYWYEEYENDPDFPPYMFMDEYGCFNASKKRLYCMYLIKEDLNPHELREWLREAMDCITPGAGDRCHLARRDGFIIAYLSEEEADAIAGHDDVVFLSPAKGF